MSQSPLHQQLWLNNGAGFNLPIQTGTFVTAALNMEERRRLSLTIGIVGGFTGTLQVQGTDEIANASPATGTPWAGVYQQPGQNGYTGGLWWSAIPSGTVSITNATNQLLLSFTDIGPAFVRLAFNVSATGSTATGSLGGSGTMQIFCTAKNT